ncbi:MAG TPA: hypothetical protein VKZ18_26245 [Polyangia bacterium]|nr:hypothetical protein [Polyangia bacterium]
MKKPLFLSSLGGLIVCLASLPALAQESTSPPPSSPPPASAPPPASSSNMGDGAMGVGAVVWLGGAGTNGPVTGAQFVYDMSAFHVEGVFGFDHVSNNGASQTGVAVGVAGWYHLAKGQNADFSIGGGAGLVYASAMGAGASETGFSLEPGAEARWFPSPNFALSARVGFAIGFGDNNAPTTFTLNGQTTGGIGFTYFFR